MLFLLGPLLLLLYRLFVTGVEDPIKYIYTVTGSSALALLYATTSLSLLRRAVNLIRYRRMVGLFSFFYAALHLLNFALLDMELDLSSAVAETLEKPFIYLGMSAFAILLFMAVTSQRALFAKFYPYHKAVYAAIVLATAHFVMAQKVLSVVQWWCLALMLLVVVLKIAQRIGSIRF